ncbi:MAG: 4'-phosphopantetheinyl transferase superfamily protein [Myxococcota bacterium]
MRDLFDARVTCTVAPIGEPDVEALPEAERALVAKAVPKRIREFCAGRTLARRMLGELGRPTEALLRGAEGSVRWPQGVQGSISHSGPWVGVALTLDPSIAGLGLDIEDATGLTEKHWRIILTGEDKCHLESWPQEARPRIAKKMFGAKEAAYKAQFPQSQMYLPFSAMWIAVSRDETSFEATFRQDAAPYRTGDVLRGRFATLQAHLISTVIAEARTR